MKNGRLPVVVEILTGISIVITLALLTAEVRGNTRALERQIRMDRAQAVAEPILESEVLRDAYRAVKTRDGWEPDMAAFMEQYGLTEEQAIAWTRFLYWAWVRVEADFEYLGRDPDLRSSIEGLLGFPDNALFWETSSEGFTPAFREWVEEIREGREAADGE
jgi:hypothetical protein